MRRAFGRILFLSLLSLGCVRSASAGIYLFQQIDMPNSTSTALHGINDADEIVGSFTTANGTSGLVLSGGMFTPINVTGDTVTVAYGINNDSQIVGYFNDANGTHGFISSLPDLMAGNFAQIDFPSSVSTVAYGVDNHGEVVGSYANANHQSHSYLRAAGIRQLPIGDAAFGINDTGWIVGLDPAIDDGLLWKKNATMFTTVHFPGSTVTLTYGINNLRQIVGTFRTGSQIHLGHGFIAHASPLGKVGSFLQLDFPGRAPTIPYGINNAGKVVGQIGIEPSHGFLARPLHVSTPAQVNLDGILHSQQVTHVTFFSTADFDAASILPATVRFGVLDISGPAPSGATPTQVVVKDVNHDGRKDLLLYFNVGDLGLQCADTIVSLEGQTNADGPIGGQAPIKVRCKPEEE